MARRSNKRKYLLRDLVGERLRLTQPYRTGGIELPAGMLVECTKVVRGKLVVRTVVWAGGVRPDNIEPDDPDGLVQRKLNLKGRAG